jgi:hypothetical protein
LRAPQTQSGWLRGELKPRLYTAEAAAVLIITGSGKESGRRPAGLSCSTYWSRHRISMIIALCGGLSGNETEG